jgi:seryl-tRNA synthetase
MVNFGEQKSGTTVRESADCGRGRTAYITLDQKRYTWDDVENMNDADLADFIKKLDGTVESIESTLEGLKGDQQVRAKDKLRHCRRWSDRIMDELMEDEDEIPCRCEELEEEVEQQKEQVRRITFSLNKHLSPALVKVILADAGT